MRIFPIIFLFLFSTQLTQGQWRYGRLLPDSVIYSTTSMSNTLYTGIDNRLVFQDSLFSNYNNLVFKCNNGKIMFDSSHFVVPRRAGNLRVEIHDESNDNTDTIGFYNFKVNPLPSPSIAFNGNIIKDSLKINIKDFTHADSLFIIVSDDIPESKDWILVKEFSVGYNYGGYFIGATSPNNIITDEMKALVEKKGKGRWFSVKVLTQSGKTLLVTNPMYKILFY
jgi:hypothetical protein